MKSLFQENLKKLAKIYSQKYIAEKTGFSQASINNYLAKTSEPSIQFLVALKNAFGINVENFLFDVYSEESNKGYDKFVGNYFIYFFNNDSYKGEVHKSLKNTLNYGVLSIYRENPQSNSVKILATFSPDRWKMIKLLKECNQSNNFEDLTQWEEGGDHTYCGDIETNDHSIFINLKCDEIGDNAYIILNNPQTAKTEYQGGMGTVNSVARGREHNPCVQLIIISKKVLDLPEGEIYNTLRLDEYNIRVDDACKDIVDIFKRLYIEQNEISLELTDEQKQSIVKNKLEYHFKNILEANIFRFAKVSNKEDDAIYNLIKEGVDA